MFKERVEFLCWDEIGFLKERRSEASPACFQCLAEVLGWGRVLPVSCFLVLLQTSTLYLRRLRFPVTKDAHLLLFHRYVSLLALLWTNLFNSKVMIIVFLTSLKWITGLKCLKQGWRLNKRHFPWLLLILLQLYQPWWWQAWQLLTMPP